MAAITIRKLDEGVKSRLRVRAAHHGRSMEDEAREILKSALVREATSEPNLAEMIRHYIDPAGGAELVISPREPVRRPPKFTK